jgi:twitching motility protein PilT
MARLDAFISILLHESADELILDTGKSAVLLKEGGPARPLLRQALTAAQVASALNEVLPKALRGVAPAAGTAFPYSSPAGLVQVRCERGIAGPRITVTPHLDEAHIVHDESLLEDELRGGLFGTVVENLAAPEEHEPYNTPPHGTPVLVQPLGRSGALDGLDALVAAAIESGASDLHLASGSAPLLRIEGSLRPMQGQPALPAARLEELIWAALPDATRTEYERARAVTCTVQRGALRFRASVFPDSRGISAAIRPIPAQPLEAERLGLPRQVLDQCFASRGLILVTGAAGSGRTSTLSALVDYINRSRDDHVLTLEEPIEQVHVNKRCLVRQREVPTQAPGFEAGLRQALREDPDVVVVGDLRDAASVALAIELATSGRLVLAELNTIGVMATLDRLLEQVPALRPALAESLRCILSQTLCRKQAGGRVAAFEVLLPTEAASAAIREGAGMLLPTALQAGREHGFVPLNEALAELVQKRLVDPREALRRSNARADLRAMLERQGVALQDKAS